MAAQIPLVESGTAGYLGQVQPLIKVLAALLCRFQYSDALGYNRIRQNALIVSRNPRPRHFPFARSVRPPVNRYIALYGARPISWGAWHLRCIKADIDRVVIVQTAFWGG